MSTPNKLSPEFFFDLDTFAYATIFEGEEYVWNVIGHIPSFLHEQFASGRIKGNYAEDVYVAKSARIDKTARIVGPAIIGENVEIKVNAYIRGNIILGNDVVIGHGSLIKKSILLNACKCSHFNLVDDSIIGNHVRLGVGAVVVNKRVDRKSITLKLENGKKIDTGLTKFGSVIGDRTRIGANAVINPGTILGKNTLVYPLESVYGFHKDHEIIR